MSAYAIFNYGRPTLVKVSGSPDLPWPWPGPFPPRECEHCRLSRMRARYRRKQRGWR